MSAKKERSLDEHGFIADPYDDASEPSRITAWSSVRPANASGRFRERRATGAEAVIHVRDLPSSEPVAYEAETSDAPERDMPHERAMSHEETASLRARASPSNEPTRRPPSAPFWRNVRNTFKGVVYDVEHWAELPPATNTERARFVVGRDHRPAYLLSALAIALIAAMLLAVVLRPRSRGAPMMLGAPAYAPPYMMAPPPWLPPSCPPLPFGT